MYKRKPHDEETYEKRLRILEKLCVPIRIGDIWNLDNETVRIVSFTRKIEFENGTSVSMDEEVGAVPWPFVTFERESSSGDLEKDWLGATGFIRGTLLVRGSGREWDPAGEARDSRKKREEKLAKEKEENDKRSRGAADQKGAYRRFGFGR